MRIKKFIKNEIEYSVEGNKIEWKEKIKTKTHLINSYVINDDIIITSKDEVCFDCDNCGREIKSKFSNYKNRKHFLCQSCLKSKTTTDFYKNITDEQKNKIRKKISRKTKEAMSKISREKRSEMTKKMIASIDWKTRNKKWIETMSSKSEEEKKEIRNKISNSLKLRYSSNGPWNLSQENIKTEYSITENKWFKRGKNSSKEILEITCDCGNVFKSNRINLARQEALHPGKLYCYKCSSIGKPSIYEKEIIEYIKSLGIMDIEENDRTILQTKELDIYIPDYKFAIEFNGLYWHSDVYKHPKYHLEKTIECELKNIRLIHIFEDEWLYNEQLVKSRLKNILGKNERRIGARETTIKEIDSKTKNNFLDATHIQGHDISSINLGAYYQDELVGVMTFSKPRIFMNKKNKDGVYELSRFSTIGNTLTPGLASKLLKYFERNYTPKKIYSYSDRRWNTGNLYEKLGFHKESFSPPNYWYFNRKDYKRYHRYKFRKSQLKEFENYSDDKTEKQIMDEAGWLRIYDCGNIKYIKKGEH